MIKKGFLNKAFSWLKKSENPESSGDESKPEAPSTVNSIEASIEQVPEPKVELPKPAEISMPLAKPPAPAPMPASSTAAMPPSKPIVTPTPAPAQKVARVREPEPQKPAAIPAIIEEGPEIKITTRGAKVYAVCPHCEATWNLKERLLVYSTKRIAAALTCPACDKPISLPISLNLKKLSSM